MLQQSTRNERKGNLRHDYMVGNRDVIEKVKGNGIHDDFKFISPTRTEISI
jgi:hypothetical protein